MYKNLPKIRLFYFHLLITVCFLAHSTCNHKDENGELNNSIQQQKDIIKQRGSHVFGRYDTTNLEFLKDLNVEWVTMVSWADQDHFDSPDITYRNGDSLRIAQAETRWLKKMKLVHDEGYKVFLKPHIWISSPTEGKWRSDIIQNNEAEWNSWSKGYREYILRFAYLAEAGKADMFCIGTELSKIALKYPLFWKGLIKEIRTIYSGPLTYAANWHDEYEKIEFWGDLDFIGVQAYFPLVKNENPTVGEVKNGWKKYLRALEKVSNHNSKRIIFTELGYKSIPEAAIKPWEWLEHTEYDSTAFSPLTQANCYKAFFETFWQKEWFAGVHLWQMRCDSGRNENSKNLDFTPRGKLAESVIKDGFGK